MIYGHLMIRSEPSRFTDYITVFFPLKQFFDSKINITIHDYQNHFQKLTAPSRLRKQIFTRETITVTFPCLVQALDNAKYPIYIKKFILINMHIELKL
jgi:alcohol dehydrogenase YqhD (iron-dependent ADH family)